MMVNGLERPSYIILESCLDTILTLINPTEEDFAKRQNVIRKFMAVVRTVENLKDARVEPFGSFVSNLFSKWGDVDISVEPRRMHLTRRDKLVILRSIKTAFQKIGGIYRLEFVPNAKVPVLKYVTLGTHISCDISVDNSPGRMKSEFLLWITQIDGRFRDLVLLVKEWAKAHGINDSRSGTLNSYSLCLLVIFHLQTCHPPVLPPLNALFEENISSSLNGPSIVAKIDAVCAANIARFKHDRFRKENQSSLSELFVSFFNKFFTIWSIAGEYAICPYKGDWEPKNAHAKWSQSPYMLLIEDPFAQPDNAARSVDMNGLIKIAKAFETTHKVLSSPYMLLDKGSLLRNLVQPRICSALGFRVVQ